MNRQKAVVIGIELEPKLKPFVELGMGIFRNILLHKSNHRGQLLMTLIKYLVEYTKTFHSVTLFPCYEPDGILSNGIAVTGLIRYINLSIIDIGVPPSNMKETMKAAVDFSYPFELFSHTFITPKPEYKPQIFGIFHTLSLSVWFAIATVFIAMLIVHYVIIRKKYSFDKTLLHVFAILVKQNSIVIPSSIVEKLLIYSWVIGTMFLCLAYDSVFLSFLAFPPVAKIKHLSDLARAIENGKYHCITSIFPVSGFAENYMESNQKYLRIIGGDISMNNLSYGHVEKTFIVNSTKQNLAMIVDTNDIDSFSGKFFVSEDRVLGGLAAIKVRKGFCCKEVLDTFVHRMMASGIYSKYYSLSRFISLLRFFLKHSEDDETKRKLTLTDVAPAFIFLLTGHFVSCLVLVVEILSNRKKNLKSPKEKNRKKNKRFNESSV